MPVTASGVGFGFIFQLVVSASRNCDFVCRRSIEIACYWCRYRVSESRQDEGNKCRESRAEKKSLRHCVVTTPSQKLSAGNRNELTGGHTKCDALKLVQIVDISLGSPLFHCVWSAMDAFALIFLFNFTGTTTNTDALPSIRFAGVYYYYFSSIWTVIIYFSLWLVKFTVSENSFRCSNNSPEYFLIKFNF